ncbi:ribosomal protein S18-alanine N-acetyltransferase [Agaribacter flavus]|uniref:ribosomal protein S18-alanine N-acetyltransferase n=1 Tax=Agaribacter flavus TaxID=1902781 RepID=UPI00366DAC90
MRHQPSIEKIAYCEYSLAYEIFCETRQTPWSFSSFESSVTSGLCYVAKENKNMLGFVLSQSMYETAEILDISVTQTRRRQGIGACLLHALIEHYASTEAESVLLEVDENNKAAIGLYKQKGFKHIDTRANYYQYQDGQRSSAWVMQLQL